MLAIITGSSKGIGFAVAAAFAREGYDIVICARDNEKLNEAAKELKKINPAVAVHAFAADLSKQNDVLKFAEKCLRIGDADILVNNAGTFLPGNCIDEPEGNMEMLMQTNVFSAYHLTRSLIHSLRRSGSAHIFNICSVAGLHAYKNGGSYSISKFALNGFSQNLRLELMNEKIKVTTVFPGAVLTDSWKGFDNSEGRIMEVDDVAAMMVAATKLSKQANVDEIILRPVEGDLN